MCAAIGLNVAADGRHDAASLTALGVRRVRLVHRRDLDIGSRLLEYVHADLAVLLVFDRLSIEAYPSPADAFADAVRRHGRYVQWWQVGNEPDLDSPSSWTMAVEDLAALGRTARACLGQRTIVAAGLASGQPSYLDGTDLSWCDAIAIHPYLKDMTRGNDLADVDELVAAYQRFGKPVWITEWGWWGDDEERGAAEIADVVAWAAMTDQIGGYFHFCADDAMAAPFGLYRTDGTPKPAVEAFRLMAAVNATVIDDVSPAPDPPLPLPEPVPMHGDDPAPIDDPTPEPILSARDAAWRDLWQSATAPPGPVPFNPDAAFYRHWQANRDAVGLPVGPEHSDDEGVFQAFSRAGVLKWAPESDVTAA